MDLRTVVLIAAMGLGALGCADAGNESTSAVSSDTPTTAVPPTTVPTTAVPPTTLPPTTLPNPVPRARGTANRASVEPATDPTADEAPGPQPRGVVDVVVGECVNVPGLREGGVTELVEIVVVDCGEPHDAEVFARVSLDENPDAAHPGDDHVVAAADQVCFERFEPYVGVRYVDTRLEIVHLRPPAAAWVRGDRAVTCLLVNTAAEPLLGSMAADR